MAGVGRPRDGQYISFDVTAFISDLKRELKKATYGIQQQILANARENLMAIPFKQNDVRLANGSITSDYDRKSAVLNSIVSKRLEWESNRILKGAVSALEKDWKDSHIGLYYEHGTGENSDFYAPAYSIGDYNPFRRGTRQIVSRSFHINGGVWTDAGGNERQTYSPRGGDRNEGFIKYVGDDTLAYHWFEQAFKQVTDKALALYKEAMTRVHPGKYFRLKPIILLGG